MTGSMCLLCAALCAIADAVLRTKRASQESNLSIIMILVPRGAVRLRPGGGSHPRRVHWWNYEGPNLPKPVSESQNGTQCATDSVFSA